MMKFMLLVLLVAGMASAVEVTMSAGDYSFPTRKTYIVEGVKYHSQNTVCMEFRRVCTYLTVVNQIFNPKSFRMHQARLNRFRLQSKAALAAGVRIYTREQNSARVTATAQYLCKAMGAGVRRYPAI